MVMAQVAGVLLPGSPYHFTQRGVTSLPIFRREGDQEWYHLPDFLTQEPFEEKRGET